VTFSLAARFIDHFHTRAQIEYRLVAWFCQFFRPLVRNTATHMEHILVKILYLGHLQNMSKIPIKVKMGQK